MGYTLDSSNNDKAFPGTVLPDDRKYPDQGPVIQSIVSLTSLLVVKMLTVLLSTISISQGFVLKKQWVAFSISHFFSKNISVYAIFNDQSFNLTWTNNIVSFEQLGPDCCFI